MDRESLVRSRKKRSSSYKPVTLVELTPQAEKMLQQLVSTGLYGESVGVAIERIVSRFLWEYVEKPIFKVKP